MKLRYHMCNPKKKNLLHFKYMSTLHIEYAVNECIFHIVLISNKIVIIIIEPQISHFGLQFPFFLNVIVCGGWGLLCVF